MGGISGSQRWGGRIFFFELGAVFQNPRNHTTNRHLPALPKGEADPVSLQDLGFPPFSALVISRLHAPLRVLPDAIICLK